MTNFEKIKNMTYDEFAGFLDDLMNGYDKSVINNWFNKKYCEVCPNIEVIYRDKKELLKECDFEGKCPNTDWDSGMVKLWLDAEEVQNENT